MKRILPFLTVFAVLICICGCKDNKSKTNSNDTVMSAVQTSENRAESGSAEQKTEIVSNQSETALPESEPSEKTTSASSGKNESAVSSPEESDVEPEFVPQKPEIYLMSSLNSDGKIRLSVRIKNNTGIAGMLIGIKYDESKVTPVSISKSKISVTSNLQQKNAVLHGTVTALYASEKGFDNDCEMFSILFEPVGKGNAEFSVTSDADSFVDLKNNYIAVDTAGSLTVEL